MARLLIVDDDAAVAEVISLTLRHAGFETWVAASRVDALNQIDEGDLDGVLLDVWLKADDGLEIADHISGLPDPLPFLIMSGGGKGRSLETVTARADALGAAAVLFKPFDDDELLHAVNLLLDNRA